MTDTTTLHETTDQRVYVRTLPAGEARVAVFTRHYDADIADVWDACTDPERLRRWYAPVSGDLRLGGTFDQGDFGQGTVLECSAPHLLRVALGGGTPQTDEVVLSLTRDGTGTTLEFEHATTLDSHVIGGQVYDAVYCMGGGYGPRLVSLDLHLRGELADDVDASHLHMNPTFGPAIQAGMAKLEELLRADDLLRSGTH